MTRYFPTFSNLRLTWPIVTWWTNCLERAVFTALMASTPGLEIFWPICLPRTYSISTWIRVNRSCGEAKCAAKFYRLTFMESRTPASINASENCSINIPFRSQTSVFTHICTCIKVATNQHDWEIYFYRVLQILKPIVSNSSKPSKLSKSQWHILTWWVSRLHNLPFCKKFRRSSRTTIVQKNWDNFSMCRG